MRKSKLDFEDDNSIILTDPPEYDLSLVALMGTSIYGTWTELKRKDQKDNSELEKVDER